MRVRRNGLHLAQLNGANSQVVEYFAFLHDACRESDGQDAMHGPRAAEFACTIRVRHIDLDDREFSLLTDAIAGHTHGHDHEDVTVRTCWDADRLDLARVGITPDPLRLCTNTARDPDTIVQASAKAERWLRRQVEGHRANLHDVPSGVDPPVISEAKYYAGGGCGDSLHVTK